MHLLLAYRAANAAATDCYALQRRLSPTKPGLCRLMAEKGFAATLADVLPMAPPQAHNYPPDVPAC